MPDPGPSPDLHSSDFPFVRLTRQTGLLPMLGAGCALTLAAFVIPVAVAWWFAGWSWWLGAGVIGGALCAAAAALLGARIVARRMLIHLASGGPLTGDAGDGGEKPAPTDAYELATELILSVYRGENDTADLFARIDREDPSVGAEAAAIVRTRAIDDLVNGMDSDEVRVERLAHLGKAVGAGARKLASPGAADPWKELAAELGEVLQELAAAMDPEANDRARSQDPGGDPT
ncbi:MAG: hypothetical protein CVU59_05840 [Deltaproteobacteria bacterium HGW-Deltaproteobacteria-17]|nr:MAG: hypothetical protein CVU59_05840 [Deltaproteobacteria bacterium HGW-Deltaproteobacteria-17]